MNIPGKLTCPPFAVTSLSYAGRWDEVQEACEVDVISPPPACSLAMRGLEQMRLRIDLRRVDQAA